MPGTVLGSEDMKVSDSPHLHSSSGGDTHTNKLTKPQTTLVDENFEKNKTGRGSKWRQGRGLNGGNFGVKTGV